MARGRLVLFVIVGVALVFGLLFGRQVYLSKGLDRQKYEQRKFRILTYKTFVGATGPGADLVNAFKKNCDCAIEITTASDAGLLLERLKLTQKSAPFDIVIGLDQMQLAQAESEMQWREMFFGDSGRHPVIAQYANKHFVPFDWSPMTFVFRKGDFAVPTKLDDLLKPEYKNSIALQDPRSSTPGLQFYNWIKTVKGADAADFLKKLRPNVHSVSESWSFAYGLFKKEQVRFVFSYVTSLAFHWGFENNRDYRVVNFEEGHPVQIEYAGVPATCQQCELAEDFVKVMMSPEGQKSIMQKNYMLPVIKGLEQDTIFGDLPALKTINVGTGKDLSDWDQAF